MQTKVLTILFADIQGYTRRTERQTREENERFIRDIRSFVEGHATNHEGALVKTMGDGFLMTFESPTNAVNCGLAMQKGLDVRNNNILDHENIVRFRIGMSTGEVNVDEGQDVFGEAVNIAARIEKFAEPNGVFISESTYLAMNKAEISALDLGLQNFKNVLREIRVYKVSKGRGEMLFQRSLKKRLGLGLVVFGLGVVGVIGWWHMTSRPPKDAPSHRAFSDERALERQLQDTLQSMERLVYLDQILFPSFDPHEAWFESAMERSDDLSQHIDMIDRLF